MFNTHHNYSKKGQKELKSEIMLKMMIFHLLFSTNVYEDPSDLAGIVAAACVAATAFFCSL
jgi:hypothetical protein